VNDRISVDDVTRSRNAVSARLPAIGAVAGRRVTLLYVSRREVAQWARSILVFVMLTDSIASR
jgi:hypothetical protein